MAVLFRSRSVRFTIDRNFASIHIDGEYMSNFHRERCRVTIFDIVITPMITIVIPVYLFHKMFSLSCRYQLLQWQEVKTKKRKENSSFVYTNGVYAMISSSLSLKKGIRISKKKNDRKKIKHVQIQR